jgi:glycerophosphoryl diester phosphodiesterase
MATTHAEIPPAGNAGPHVRPLVVAHRGASSEAPENTLAAFRLAWEQGADAIEGDFHLTADGAIVCLHDPTTARTAGADLVVARSTLQQLQQLDVGSWKGDRFAGQRIATLQQVLDAVPAGGLVFLELKCGPEIVPPLQLVLEAVPVPPSHTVVMSFDAAVVALAKSLMPQRTVLWLAEFKCQAQRVLFPTPDTLLPILQSLRADGVGCENHPALDAELVQAVRQAGKQFHVWTVNDPRRAAMLAGWGVRSLTTDEPARIRQALGR